MKHKIALLALLLLSVGCIAGRDVEDKYPGDLATLDLTMAAPYGVITGEKLFYEVELDRTVNTNNHIKRVFTTYKSYHTRNDNEPFMRGINGLQLLNDSARNWIVTIYWSQETEAHAILAKYLLRQ